MAGHEVSMMPQSKPSAAPLRAPSPGSVMTLLMGLLVVIFAGLLGHPALAGKVQLQPGPDGGVGPVVVLPIEGTVELGMAPYIRRAVREANENGAAAVILEVDTFGGRVDAAAAIRDTLLESDVPIVVFVKRRAISAGALISMAGDALYFAPGASMGAATPVTLEGDEVTAADEKMISYMRGEMRATAEAQGRPTALAEAMVDRDVAVAGVVEAGKLLTLSADEAFTLGLSDGTLPDLDAVLKAIGGENAERQAPAPNWGEQLARWLTDPAVAGVLMSLGMLGIFIELYQPGFGLPGVVGLSCLGAFMLGHVSAELVGWEELLLVGVGLVLLLIEVFVIPGFGVVGVLGLVCIGGGLALSMTSLSVGEAFHAGVLGDAAGAVVLSLGGTAILLFIAMIFLPTRSLPGWLVLHRTIDSTAQGAKGGADPLPMTDPHRRLGWRGRAATDLRLSGHARLAPPAGGPDELVDVVSQFDYIDRDTEVVVVAVEGARVVVDRLPST
jgi:membrane-bound serine protease (ClpP class)